MGRKPMFYNALMLTGVNLLLRMVGTSFQVFISGRIGAEGVGVLQLVLSVAGLAMTAGIAGVRTTTMYLTAEELGKKRPQNVVWVLTGCFTYSLIFSLLVGSLIYGFAPQIAGRWIGESRTLGAVRLFAVFLPLSCFSGVMSGYFTAANRIGTLAVVEVVEQLCSMIVTTVLLLFWAGQDIGRACQSVIMGSCAGSCVTLGCLVVLRLLERAKTGKRIPVAKRLRDTALPLALADDLKAGISTTENLMVPKRLALYTGQALAQFGMVCGMVFPVLMFPAAILYGLADLLIPELARCRAAGSWRRIRYLVKRSLRVAALYGVFCGGVLFLLAVPLCLRLYENAGAGEYLQWFALFAPMLYCDAIVDAMTKGLGQQKICVRYNILTSFLDVVFLFVLLPRYGMKGYFVSFLVTHVINAALSLRLLLKITGMKLPVKIPCILIGVMVVGVLAAGFLNHPVLQVAAYLAGGGSLLYLLGIIGREDLQWLRGLVFPSKKLVKSKEKMKNNI